MRPEARPSVSIVIPCYNEQLNLQRGCLTHVAAYAARADDIREVLVVDDGSTDASRRLVTTLARQHAKLRLLPEPHRGKAGAVIAGIMAAQGAYVLFTDMDQATPIEEFEKFRAYLQQGYDIVIGSRLGRRVGAPLVRQLMATGFALLRRVILDLGRLADTQCGFKSLKADVARGLCAQLRVFEPGRQHARGAAVTAGFDAELLFVARRMKVQIAEVPVTWHYVGTHRVHPLRESWRGLTALLLIRLAARRGAYEHGSIPYAPPEAAAGASSEPQPRSAARSS